MIQDVVQRQFEAYNERDIEKFIACFAAEAEIGNLGASQPLMKGKERIREGYRQLFEKSPRLHCDILNRTIFAHVVIDYERVTGRLGSSEAVEIIAIYEVQDNLIQRVHFIRQSAF